MMVGSLQRPYVRRSGSLCIGPTAAGLVVPGREAEAGGSLGDCPLPCARRLFPPQCPRVLLDRRAWMLCAEAEQAKVRLGRAQVLHRDDAHPYLSAFQRRRAAGRAVDEQRPVRLSLEVADVAVRQRDLVDRFALECFLADHVSAPAVELLLQECKLAAQLERRRVRARVDRVFSVVDVLGLAVVRRLGAAGERPDPPRRVRRARELPGFRVTTTCEYSAVYLAHELLVQDH